METRMKKPKRKNLHIRQICILSNCNCDDCYSTSKACELNQSDQGYFYHFHSIEERRNQILVKKYLTKEERKLRGLSEEEAREYIRCDVLNSKGKTKLSCTNTTRGMAWTLPNDFAEKILYVIKGC